MQVLYTRFAIQRSDELRARTSQLEGSSHGYYVKICCSSGVRRLNHRPYSGSINKYYGKQKETMRSIKL